MESNAQKPKMTVEEYNLLPLTDKQIEYVKTLQTELTEITKEVVEISDYKKLTMKHLNTLLFAVNTKKPATKKQLEVVNRIIKKDPEALEFSESQSMSLFHAGEVISRFGNTTSGEFLQNAFADVK